MKNILVTGSNGQLGSEIRELSIQYPNLKFWFTDVAELNICDLEAIRTFLTDKQIDFIVNCAAYTAVDKAESDVLNCSRINADAVSNLGEAASAIGARVIHISTDYVYTGTNCSPYCETDGTAPFSVYGITKLAGEKELFRQCPESLVLRTSWLYSVYGSNFVKTMIRLGIERDKLGVIFDQIGTPTYAADLARTILLIIDGTLFVPGVYNYSNEGVCSWYDFALKIHELAGITGCQVSPIETSDYPTPAKRPPYSVMNKKKIKETFGIKIPHWEASLKKCISRLQ